MNAQPLLACTKRLGFFTCSRREHTSYPLPFSSPHPKTRRRHTCLKSPYDLQFPQHAPSMTAPPYSALTFPVPPSPYEHTPTIRQRSLTVLTSMPVHVHIRKAKNPQRSCILAIWFSHARSMFRHLSSSRFPRRIHGAASDPRAARAPYIFWRFIHICIAFLVLHYLIAL